MQRSSSKRSSNECYMYRINNNNNNNRKMINQTAFSIEKAYTNLRDDDDNEDD